MNTFQKIFLIGTLVLLSFGLFVIQRLPREPGETVACTQDAKLCPDGSYVGRVGSQCEFASCPGEIEENTLPPEKGQAVVFGKVDIGPICPVEREGVPCPVPPEVYTSREVIVYKKDGKTIVARQHLNLKGEYRFEIPAGSYVIDIAQSGIDFSKELPLDITLSEGKLLEVNFSIDTGIR